MDPLIFLEEEIVDCEFEDSDDEYISNLQLMASPLASPRESIPDFQLFLQNCSGGAYQQHMRVSRDIGLMLLERFEASTFLTSYRSISPWKQLNIFFWFVAHEACSFRDMVNRFHVSLSHLHNILKNVARFLSSLGEEFIVWPSEQAQNSSVTAFYRKAQFPGVIGCIDGTHINIDKPTLQHQDYFDRKKNYSFKLQGICNENKEFIDIFIGMPGSVHDARMYRLSPVQAKINSLPSGIYILGDSAYPLQAHLLTPHRDNGHLTERQVDFNQRHSTSRQSIEHTFGLLKQRFRCLYHLKLRSLEDMVYVTKACCVLHNVCIKFGATILEELESIGEEEEVLEVLEEQNQERNFRDEIIF